MSSEDVDDILKHLQELENQGQLSASAESQIQTLKFGLRYVRIHVKWKSFSPNLLGTVRTWVRDVQMRLVQPTRNRSMAADLLEEILSHLLQNNYLFFVILGNQCLDYYRGEFNGLGIAYKDVLIDELVIDWIDPLLENLKHIIHLNDLNLIDVSKRLIKDLEEKLLSMKNFLLFTGKEFEIIDNLTPRQGLLHKTSEDLLTRVKFLIENAIYLSYKLWMQRKIFSMDKFVYDLLVKIRHIEPEIKMISVQSLKASMTANPGILGIDLRALVSVDSLLSNLEELMKKDQDDGSTVPLDTHQLASLHQELSFLRYFLMDPHLKEYTNLEPESFNSLLMQVEAMAREAAPLTHSICDDEKKNDLAKEMNQVLFNLLEIINLLKAKIKQMYLRVLKPSASKFPQTPKLSFLSFFVQNLEELLQQRVDSIAYVKNEIEIVLSEFSLLHDFVMVAIKNPEKDENIARRVVDVAYETERVIDLILASHFPRWSYMIWLSDVIEKIKLLRKESAEVCANKKCNINGLNVEKSSTRDPPEAVILTDEEDMVGFQDEADKIIVRLTTGPEQLDIVSIVGMPGLGKTTLAKKVFENPLVTKHFHVRSWYCISQVYDMRELLLSILGNVTELTKEIREMNEEGMAEVLYRSLKGKRYLIFLDDIWSIEPWRKIRISFPDDHKGSRILFTTRIKEVPLQANPKSAPHELRLFLGEESWKLLQNKVFRQRSCPPKLHDIGEQIAKNCKGLPLSVVVIAGVLVRLEQNEDHWKRVLESLRKQVVGDSNKCTNVLELSYNHLPDHLKPCFLYLGAFPQDEEIPSWKLKRLWIAEGLVQKTKSESLEDVAEDYLTDLIARSLVFIAQNKSIGGVKSCRVHDLLQEFSLKKAKDENFLLVSQEMVNLEQYRHCFYGKQDYLHGWMPKDSYARSVFLFPNENVFANLLVLPYILKLLRVLDLERITLSRHKYPIEIELLVHLRYLALRGQLDHVPSSVGNLWRLETFLVKGTKGEVKLPETLLKMAYLKHVCVNDRVAFELSDDFQPEKSFDLDCVEKLSTLSLRLGDGTMEKVIRRLRSLRKLKCIILESLDYNLLQVLDFPSELKSINLTYQGRGRHPCDLSFCSTLKKLTLSKFRLPWSEMSKIGRLPQLEVLKLLFRAFEGERWEVNSDEFCSLKVLKLESLDIVEWNAPQNAFQSLEHLVLQSCKLLKNINSGFGELATLRMVEVKWCSYSACKAVQKIEKDQEDFIPDGLKVIIQPLDWDSAPA